MKYRISDIRNFVSATKCTTIVQAAQKLEISQPALSESLKRLEEDLGETVFYRSRTGIQLTPSGKVFLIKAQTLMNAFTDLDIRPSSDQVFSGQTITIGCHATVAQYTLPHSLKYIKDFASDVKVEIVHNLSRSIQADIQKGRIDIGVVVNAVEVPDLIIQKISTDIVGVWTSTNTKAQHDTIICHQDLFQTQSILRRWKNKPDRMITTDSLELICRLTQEGIGYGIIPTKAVQLVTQKLKLLSDLPTFKDEISLIYRPEFGRNPAEKLVIKALKESL